MKNNKWYSLPAIPTLLIVAAAAVLLTATLTGDLGPVLTYFSYLFSTYDHPKHENYAKTAQQ